MGRITLLAVGVILSVSVSGCLGEKLETPPSADHAPEHHPEAEQSSDQTLGEPTIRIEVRAGSSEQELRFSPEAVYVRQGDIVEVTIRNAGRAPHTWTIHDLALDTGVLDPGEWTTIKFRADREGVFESMCDVAGHYDAGMKGTLEIT